MQSFDFSLDYTFYKMAADILVSYP